LKIAHLAILIMALAFIVSKASASDSSYKKPSFLSVSVGTTSRLVYGSRVDKTRAEDPTVEMINNKSFAYHFDYKSNYLTLFTLQQASVI
jgi:hypothetical protein